MSINKPNDTLDHCSPHLGPFLSPSGRSGAEGADGSQGVTKLQAFGALPASIIFVSVPSMCFKCRLRFLFRLRLRCCQLLASISQDPSEREHYHHWEVRLAYHLHHQKMFVDGSARWGSQATLSVDRFPVKNFSVQASSCPTGHLHPCIACLG